MKTGAADETHPPRPRVLAQPGSVRRMFGGDRPTLSTLTVNLPMRIPSRLLAVSALAALAACAEPRPAANTEGATAFAPTQARAGAATPQDNARGIVFAVVRRRDGEGAMEPVALLLPQGYAAPTYADSDSAQRAFNARWLGTGRSYDVLSRGERVGSIAVRTADEPACTGLGASGTMDVRPAPPTGWQGLAGAGLPAQAGAPWLRAPTIEEKRELDRMAAALFAAHGIDAAARTPGTDTASAALLVHPNARPVLVASYTLDETQASYLRRGALLLVAEEGETGYRPAHVWFNEGVEEDVETQQLIDAADLDGDGMPELVVRHGYYESWDFEILRRGELGWTRAYRGGGGGC
jgi:hypothetical protein